jgi:hypothetical protein
LERSKNRPFSAQCVGFSFGVAPCALSAQRDAARVTNTRTRFSLRTGPDRPSVRPPPRSGPSQTRAALPGPDGHRPRPLPKLVRARRPLFLRPYARELRPPRVGCPRARAPATGLARTGRISDPSSCFVSSTQDSPTARTPRGHVRSCRRWHTAPRHVVVHSWTSTPRRRGGGESPPRGAMSSTSTKRLRRGDARRLRCARCGLRAKRSRSWRFCVQEQWLFFVGPRRGNSWPQLPPPGQCGRGERGAKILGG